MVLPALAALLALGAAGPAAPQASSDIPWNSSLVISRTSSNDDIRNVLRSILQANGLGVVFGPGVQGPISFQLDRAPIDSAFDQLIDQYNLAYSYDPTTRTVMVTSRAAGPTASRETVSVPLDPRGFEQLGEALTSLGLGLDGVDYDSFDQTLTITGDSGRVDRVVGLLTTMRPDLLMVLAQQEDQASGGPYQAVPAAPAPPPPPPPPPAEPQEIAVIPLRFASVGESTRRFQGRDVTVPGIAETLYSIMGEARPGTRVAGDANMVISTGDEAPPRISIDQRTNSVVVQGTQAQIDQVRRILAELDRPLQMVQIEVIIASADIGVARQLGVAWRASGLATGDNPASIGVDTGVSGDPIGNPDSGADPFDTTGLDALNLLPDTAGTAASFVIRGSEAALQAQLQALAREDKARILSAPRLVTLDNLTARITRSQNIYVQIDTRLEGGGTGGVGLQEIQTGLTLEITPSIVPAQSAQDEALVRLNLRAENSAPGNGVLGQIDVRSQEVQTNVLVPDGATFVIGGLFDDQQITGTGGVPGLRNLPVVGGLFRNETRQDTVGETIFFITPRLVDEQTVLQSDIAVRVGSQEYMDRQRRLLHSESDFIGADGQESSAAIVYGGAAPARLQEDE